MRETLHNGTEVIRRKMLQTSNVAERILFIVAGRLVTNNYRVSVDADIRRIGDIVED